MNRYPSWRDTEFISVVAAARKSMRNIVIANGVFDLLHVGHLSVFRTARMADIVSVGPFVIAALNSDESVRTIRGRPPVVPLAERLEMVAAIRYVDVAVAFEEADPTAMIKFIQPDYLVKGMEYAPTKTNHARPVPGAEHVRSSVLFAPEVGDTHSSTLAQRAAVHELDAVTAHLQSALDACRKFRVAVAVEKR